MNARTLHYTVNANQADLWFTLHGDEELVIRNIRELYYQFLQDDQCSWLKVSKSSHDDDTTSYSIYMRNSNIVAMEKVLWFMGKILGELPKLNFSFLKLTDIMVTPSGADSTKPLSTLLNNALTRARSRLDEPLTFNHQDINHPDYFIPNGLWTPNEVNEDRKVRETIEGCQIDALPETGQGWPTLFHHVSDRIQQTLAVVSLDKALGKRSPQ